jgi:anti-sigma regulatory factor (Ser/Thr protein kinase)
MWRFEVRDPADLYGPRREVRAVGATIGFSRAHCHELAIVVSELTSNILKYGVRGSIQFERVDSAERGPGLLVIARDIGPPFRDVDMALKDGHDDRGPIDPVLLLKRSGLGAGLGAVLRLTHSFQICETPPIGKEIRVIRHLKAPRP